MGSHIKFTDEFHEKQRTKHRAYCRRHEEELRAKRRVYRQNHREKQLAKSRAYRQEHPDEVRASNSKYYQEHKDKIKAQAKVRREKRAEAYRGVRIQCRLAVLTHYSSGTPKCARCGISDVDVLALDHIADGGIADRKVRGQGNTLFKALIEEGFPPGYQVLCFNCNFKKEIERRRLQWQLNQRTKRRLMIQEL